MTEAKRRVHRFNFDQETMKSGRKTHVALVDSAANLTEALVMKASSYITQTTEVDEYNDDGSYANSRDTTRVSDYSGDDYITVTNEQVSVVTTRYPKLNVI